MAKTSRNPSHAISGIFEFVEIRTKLTSVLVFAYCLAFAFQAQLPVRLLPTLVFFLATLLIDLATTSINNYQGYKRENEALTVSPRFGKILIYALLLSSAVLGLLLVFLSSNVLVLLSGLFCFLIGLSYTTGPLPISHTPFGEFFSGILYGFFIPFIFALINLPAEQFILLQPDASLLKFTLHWPHLLALLGLALIPTALVANVMLANNSCDLAKDRALGRYTLPSYLGNKALTLYALLNLLHYPLILLLIFCGVFSPWQLLSLLTLIPVYRNTRLFMAKQDKRTTFGLSLKNLLLIMGSLIFSLVLGGLFNKIF